MNEQEAIYDAEIAPALLAICKRCEALGMPMVASVEYSPDQTSTTIFCPDPKGDKRPSAQQMLVYYAARCNGNVDGLIFAIMRAAEKYGHASVCLRSLGVAEKPTSR